MEQTLSREKGIQKLKRLKGFSSKKTTAKFEIVVKHDPIKRLFDFCLSVFFLILSSPLFALFSLLIPLASLGPIFYKSPRLGRGGKLIYCYKFRTMYKDAEERLQDLLESNLEFRTEWEIFQKVRKDPRITPIGKFLRKFSLDEIPQFWNVLKGDLSLVGPRPPTLMGPPEKFLEEICLLYGKDTAAKILSVRPGITGVWQISGRSEISFDDRKKMEESYCDSRTFLKDLVVILKTVPAVLFSKGAF